MTLCIKRHLDFKMSRCMECSADGADEAVIMHEAGKVKHGTVTRKSCCFFPQPSLITVPLPVATQAAGFPAHSP